MQNAAAGWSLDPGAMRVILLVRASRSRHKHEAGGAQPGVIS
jgi:hypothetical protein